MLRKLRLFFGLALCVFRSRQSVLIANLALRQQLVVLKSKHPQPRLRATERLFWIALRRLWPEWERALILMEPETVIRWHRAGFKSYWAWISRRRKRSGRRATSKELRELIFRMVAEIGRGKRRESMVN